MEHEISPVGAFVDKRRGGSPWHETEQAQVQPDHKPGREEEPPQPFEWRFSREAEDGCMITSLCVDEPVGRPKDGFEGVLKLSYTVPGQERDLAYIERIDPSQPLETGNNARLYTWDTLDYRLTQHPPMSLADAKETAIDDMPRVLEQHVTALHEEIERDRMAYAGYEQRYQEDMGAAKVMADQYARQFTTLQEREASLWDRRGGVEDRER